ncbi:gephyrin-like [Temnothorax longispinosus]|uniref:gephyrin-like n=1 Tax=Temnothorax longispinosus TaxID=300112 RepID=UPI003A98D29B
MSEMAIRAQFVILHQSGTIDSEESEDLLDPRFNVKYEEFFQIIADTPNVEVVDITVVRPVKIIITKKLLSTCTNNKADIIFIIGDVESTEKRYANEAIETVTVDRKKLSTDLINLMTNMEKKLKEITHYKYGIRNKTLFINLSGLNNDKRECFTAILDMLPNMTHLIHENETQRPSLSDIACSFNDEFPKQGKDKNANENLETSSVSLTSSQSSLTENMNDNPNNCHKQLFPTILLEEALDILNQVAQAGMDKINHESVKIKDAYGRVLCENVHPNCCVPPFRTSYKHGYAVSVKDGKGLRRVQEGENRFPPLPLQPGTCVWVNNGAPIPNGATAVVPEKDTKPLKESPNNDSKYIEILIEPNSGQNIKPIGFDICSKKNNIILKKFTRIGPEEIGLLTACGCKNVTVAKQLSMGVLSIGDNLEEPGEPLKPGFVYDINRITLISLLKHNSYSPLDFGIVNNKCSSIREKIEKALERVDILVTTGSINDKDLLKIILTKYLKAEIHFGNVDIKPGKSTALASCKFNDETKYFLCLSGNPTSAFIAAHMFLLPFVNKLHCDLSADPVAISVQTNPRNALFLLHHRRRLAWADLEFDDIKKITKASGMDSFSKNKLCNMVCSNALLLLPKRKQDEKLLPKTNNTTALLIDYPRKLISLLPYRLRSNKTLEKVQHKYKI